MAANDILGDQLRKMLIDRLPDIISSLRTVDPMGTGFVNKYDFRKALYVDAILGYDDVMTTVKDAPTSNGKIAYNVWVDTLPFGSPHRAHLFNDTPNEDSEKDIIAEIQQMVTNNFSNLLDAFRSFDAEHRGYITIYDFRRCIYLYLGISKEHTDMMFRSIGYAENGFINYLGWLNGIDTNAIDLTRYYKAVNPALDDFSGKEVMEPRLAALRHKMLSEPNIQMRGSASPAIMELDRFRHRLRETEEIRARLSLKNHVSDVRRSELEGELRQTDLVLQDREYARRLANRAEENEAMQLHSQLHSQLMALSNTPPVPPEAEAKSAECSHFANHLKHIEQHLEYLNKEKMELDHKAHVDRMNRLHTHPHLPGSHAHALYSGGVTALPPRSWLDEAPVTRQCLMTTVPLEKLEPQTKVDILNELKVLKKMNPAETIATLQRLQIPSSEKLQLYRDLDLESVPGIHPSGMLAHAKAGLPLHPREAEAQLMEQVRASHASDVDKVQLIRDLPLSPSKKIELLSELK